MPSKQSSFWDPVPGVLHMWKPLLLGAATAATLLASATAAKAWFG